MFASDPVSRLSRQTTRCPFASSASQRWEPRKPGAAGDDGGRHRARSYPRPRQRRSSLTKSSRPPRSSEGLYLPTRVLGSSGRVHGSPPQGPASPTLRHRPRNGGARGDARCLHSADCEQGSARPADRRSASATRRARESNPYMSNEPAIANNGDLQGGHLNHTGPVYPADDWGDIIPPYEYVDENGQTQTFPGLQLAEAGQAIWQNGCNPPSPPTPNRSRPCSSASSAWTAGSWRTSATTTRTRPPSTPPADENFFSPGAAESGAAEDVRPGAPRRCVPGGVAASADLAAHGQRRVTADEARTRCAGLDHGRQGTRPGRRRRALRPEDRRRGRGRRSRRRQRGHDRHDRRYGRHAHR